MLRSLLASTRLAGIVAVAVAVLLVAVASAEPSDPSIELTASASGSLAISNSKEATAILSAAGLRPGDSASGTVTIGNSGDVAAEFSLSSSALADTPGPNGGELSNALEVAVRDVTDAGSPTTVWNGTLAAMPTVALGTLSPGDDRTYEFAVAFPDGSDDDAFQDSSLSVQYDWTATASEPDEEAPETTITATPGAPSATTVRFRFSSSEDESSFQCSLDGAAFAACTSPKTYDALADGGHTFAVRATDSAGNTDATAATFAWDVDGEPPAAAFADPGALLAGTAPLFASASDAKSGVRRVEFQYSPAGAAAWTTIARDDAAPYAATWDTTGLADGRYDLRVVATDNVANSAVAKVDGSRLVDNTPVPASETGGGSNGTGGGTTTPPPASPGSGTPLPTGPAPSTGGDDPVATPFAPAEEAVEEADGDVTPGSIVAAPLADESSGVRQGLGAALLTAALLGAGVGAWRVRRPPAPVAANGDEPLLFWDQRLLRLVTDALRRLGGR